MLNLSVPLLAVMGKKVDLLQQTKKKITALLANETKCCLPCRHYESRMFDSPHAEIIVVMGFAIFTVSPQKIKQHAHDSSGRSVSHGCQLPSMNLNPRSDLLQTIVH